MRFQQISLEQGLPQSVVTKIIQDSDGFIWFATQDGLARFDGYDFIYIKHDPLDSTSLSDNYVWTMFEDNERNLWVGTNGGGLDCLNLDSREITHYRQDPNSARIGANNVIAVIRDRHRTIWVGSADGLDTLDVETGKFTKILDTRKYGKTSQANVNAICETREGTIYASTFGTGVFRFKRPNLELERVAPSRYRLMARRSSLGRGIVEAIACVTSLSGMSTRTV